MRAKTFRMQFFLCVQTFRTPWDPTSDTIVARKPIFVTRIYWDPFQTRDFAFSTSLTRFKHGGFPLKAQLNKNRITVIVDKKRNKDSTLTWNKRKYVGLTWRRDYQKKREVQTTARSLHVREYAVFNNYKYKLLQGHSIFFTMTNTNWFWNSTFKYWQPSS